MRAFPAGPPQVFFSGADLGFDNQLVGTNSEVAGAIIPWSCVKAIEWACFFIERVSGAGTPWDLRWRAYDIDGVTPIGVRANIVGNIANPVQSWSIFSCGRTAVASSGAVIDGETPHVLKPAYGQVVVFNSDVTNTINVTVTALLK